MTEPHRILLLGASGQLGLALQPLLRPLGLLLTPTSEEIDLRFPEQLPERITPLAPTLIINAAAYNAVDKAETEADLAMTLNHQAPAKLATVAHGLGCRLVHYSSDYVFDGLKTTPYRETDTPAPLSLYGRSKWLGEQAVLATDSHLVFRVSWLWSGDRHNFARTILRKIGQHESLRIVDDQFGAPTTTHLVAAMTLRALSLPGGLYHLAARGETSWFGFAQALLAAAVSQGELPPSALARITPVATADYPLPARRPRNSRLDCQKLETALGLTLPPWTEPIPAMIRAMKTDFQSP